MSSLTNTITIESTYTPVTQEETFTRYSGFSTQTTPDGEQPSGYRLFDVELIKQDIVNYFNIRKGSKLMNPEFGTVIWDLLFEPFTQDVVSLVYDDILAGVRLDPRVVPSDVNVRADYERSAILVSMRLTVVPGYQTAPLEMTFDPNTGLSAV